MTSWSESHQCDDGALGRELSGAEERPDEPVDLLLLWIVFIVIRWNLRLLQQTDATNLTITNSEEHRDVYLYLYCMSEVVFIFSE